MIRYALKCSNDHGFESWFQSAKAFDTLVASHMVNCPTCDDTEIKKVLMAPRVSTARKKTEAPVPSSPEPQKPMMTNSPDPKLAEALKTLREHVEKNSDYVGDRFASEARAMHDGTKPHRAIYGEAKPEEAKKLIEDGVPALPLPFIPRQKTN